MKNPAPQLEKNPPVASQQHREQPWNKLCQHITELNHALTPVTDRTLPGAPGYPGGGWELILQAATDLAQRSGKGSQAGAALSPGVHRGAGCGPVPWEADSATPALRRQRCKPQDVLVAIACVIFMSCSNRSQ